MRTKVGGVQVFLTKDLSRLTLRTAKEAVDLDWLVPGAWWVLICCAAFLFRRNHLVTTLIWSSRERTIALSKDEHLRRGKVDGLVLDHMSWSMCYPNAMRQWDYRWKGKMRKVLGDPRRCLYKNDLGADPLFLEIISSRHFGNLPFLSSSKLASLASSSAIKTRIIISFGHRVKLFAGCSELSWLDKMFTSLSFL